MKRRIVESVHTFIANQKTGEVDVNFNTSSGLFSLSFSYPALSKLIADFSAVQAQLKTGTEKTYVGTPAVVKASSHEGHIVLSFRMTNGLEHHMALTKEQASKVSSELNHLLPKN